MSTEYRKQWELWEENIFLLPLLRKMLIMTTSKVAPNYIKCFLKNIWYNIVAH